MTKTYFYFLTNRIADENFDDLKRFMFRKKETTKGQ